MKNFLMALICTISFSAMAYTPTAESLFRSGANPDLLGSTVIANLKVTLLDSEEVSSVNGVDLGSLTRRDREKYYKFLIYTDEEGNGRLLQLNYNQGFAKSELNKVIYKPYMTYKNLGLNQEQIDKGVFYSLISSLFTNSGTMMIDTVNAHGGVLKKNREILNKNQLQLISRYKWFIQQSKSNPDLKNPMLAESSEEKERLEETINSPFYEKSPYVKRVRKEDEFFWEIDSDKLFARFVQADRQLEKLVFKSNYGDVEVNLKSYVLFNANFIFPQYIYIKDLSKLQYKVELQKVVILQDNQDNFTKRYKNYEKELEGKTLDRSSNVFTPSFIY